MHRLYHHIPPVTSLRHASRRGVFMAVSAVCLMALMAFVAYAVDIGIISLTKTKMQNATDAAALAAAMEITEAVANAGEDIQDVFEYAKSKARAEAQNVAELNKIYVNPSADVTFGRRYQNEGEYIIDWNANSNQINVVKVVARRDSGSKNAPDAKVPGIFSSAFGGKGNVVRTESIAFIEPRDMVVVHDFSRSMNFDSYFTDEQENYLSQAQIESNLSLAWNDLGQPSYGGMTYDPEFCKATQSNTGAKASVTFKGTSVSASTNTKIKTVKLFFENGNSQTFNISNETTTSGTWAGTGSYNGTRIKQVHITVRKVGSTTQNWTLNFQYDDSTIASSLGLSSVTYPYESGSWSDYFDFVKTDGGLKKYGYQDKFGGMTWLCYLMKEKSSYNETNDLWKTRHYPFHAIKEGHELLCDFLADLGFDDHLGMVSYDSNHRIETTISDSNPEFPSVDLSATPLSNQYGEVKKLMHYKQASHYSNSTNMAGGIKDGIALLDAHKRMGSRPTIILMTDGNGNTLDTGEKTSLPNGWNWSSLFDYDGNGSADYSTSDNSAKVTLRYVKEAVDKGYTVHAISVGVDADAELLKAVAFLGNGYFIQVPGGQSVSDMEADVKAAFTKIAAAVPPARLVKGD